MASGEESPQGDGETSGRGPPTVQQEGQSRVPGKWEQVTCVV